MADQAHAEVLEVLGRQLGQDAGVDGVLAERWLVLLKAQAAQPGRDV